MKKNRLFGLLLFLLVTNNMCAQLGKAVREILTGDSVATRTAVRNDSDSVRMADMKKELEAESFCCRLCEISSAKGTYRLTSPVYAGSTGSGRRRYIVLFVYQAWGIYPFAAGRNDRCGHHAVG